MEYLLINKTIFLPKSGILAIGDLHLGYESLHKKNPEIPFNQLQNTKKEIDSIIQEIKSKNLELKKIILLGDITHFSILGNSKSELKDFLKFLEQYLPPDKIILIKGNHERLFLNNQEYQNFHIEENLIFSHGDKIYPEILNENFKTIIMAHSHPAIILEKEKYKCYLIGKWKDKEVFILPSFIPMIAGTEINEEYIDMPGFSIIPKSDLKKLNIFVIDKNGKVFEFK